MTFEEWLEQNDMGRYSCLHDAWDAAVKAERERCAALCEDAARGSKSFQQAALTFAKAIRESE